MLGLYETDKKVGHRKFANWFGFGAIHVNSSHTPSSDFAVPRLHPLAMLVCHASLRCVEHYFVNVMQWVRWQYILSYVNVVKPKDYTFARETAAILSSGH